MWEVWTHCLSSQLSSKICSHHAGGMGPDSALDSLEVVPEVFRDSKSVMPALHHLSIPGILSSLIFVCHVEVGGWVQDAWWLLDAVSGSAQETGTHNPWWPAAHDTLQPPLSCAGWQAGHTADPMSMCFRGGGGVPWQGAVRSGHGGTWSSEGRVLALGLFWKSQRRLQGTVCSDVVQAWGHACPWLGANQLRDVQEHPLPAGLGKYRLPLLCPPQGWTWILFTLDLN